MIIGCSVAVKVSSMWERDFVVTPLSELAVNGAVLGCDIAEKSKL